MSPESTTVDLPRSFSAAPRRELYASTRSFSFIASMTSSTEDMLSERDAFSLGSYDVCSCKVRRHHWVFAQSGGWSSLKPNLDVFPRLE